MDEKVIDKIVAEVMSRITMMPDDGEYEMVTHRLHCHLAIAGGGANPKCTLTPVVIGSDDTRREGESMTFTFYRNGQEPMKLDDWIRSDPWSKIIAQSGNSE